MPKKFKCLTVPLYISLVIPFIAICLPTYLWVFGGGGGGAMSFGMAKEMKLIFIGGVIGALFIMKVIKDLKNRKYWSWFAAIFLALYFLLMIYPIPLGIIMLYGLFQKDTREYYKKKSNI
jgi:hypothetical protein